MSRLYNLRLDKNLNPWIWSDDFKEIWTWKPKQIISGDYTEFKIKGGGIHLAITPEKKDKGSLEKMLSSALEFYGKL